MSWLTPPSPSFGTSPLARRRSLTSVIQNHPIWGGFDSVVGSGPACWKWKIYKSGGLDIFDGNSLIILNMKPTHFVWVLANPDVENTHIGWVLDVRQWFLLLNITHLTFFSDPLWLVLGYLGLQPTCPQGSMQLYSQEQGISQPNYLPLLFEQQLVPRSLNTPFYSSGPLLNNTFQMPIVKIDHQSPNSPFTSKEYHRLWTTSLSPCKEYGIIFLVTIWLHPSLWPWVWCLHIHEPDFRGNHLCRGSQCQRGSSFLQNTPWIPVTGSGRRILWCQCTTTTTRQPSDFFLPVD